MLCCCGHTHQHECWCGCSYPEMETEPVPAYWGQPELIGDGYRPVLDDA